MSPIETAASFSQERLVRIRAELNASTVDQLVVTCGSYARKDASLSSDMDYFMIVQENEDENAAKTKAIVDGVIQEIVGKLPSIDGAFAANVSVKELLANYGGVNDSNITITRRMLYLLEGEYLTQEQSFRNLRKRIIQRYVHNTPRDHQIAFYLLNDIVRYWRTLAVDYADKTYGRAEPKPWAIRNIKLIFSRKLIYASGLFSVALTADRRKEDKVEILERMFDMTPLERLAYVSGDSQSRRVVEMYGEFLQIISDVGVRKSLDELTPQTSGGDVVYRRLKNEGHYFSRELMGLFQRTFHSSHPIHMAVIF